MPDGELVAVAAVGGRPAPGRRLSPLAAMLWAKSRVARHSLALVRRESRLKVAFVSVSALLLWIGIFVFALLGLRLFETFGAEVLGEGALTVSDLVVARMLSVFALALFVMLVFSNVLVAFATLYRSREVPFLVLAPVTRSSFFLGRFYECVAFSSWASAFLGSPILLAYGLTTQAPLLFYPMLAAFYVPFVVIPAAIGAVVAMALVRYLAGARRGPLVGFGLLALALLFSYFRGKLRSPDLADTATIQAIVDVMGRTQSPYLPSHWLARGVLSAATGEAGDALFYFLLLAANALLLLWLAAQAAEAWFFTGWSALADGGETRRRGRGRGPFGALDVVLRVLPQPTRALMAKDFRLFWRDPAQWAQFVLFFGIMALYVANLGEARSFARHGTWGAWATLLNLAACMLILASLTSRFVYPLVSLEGPRIWMLGLAPVGMRRIVWQKLWLSVGSTSVFTVSLAVLSALRLDLDGTSFGISLVAIVGATVALSGLAVGLGSLYPNFREDNPSRIVSGMGGTLNFILSMVYIVLVTLALAAVLLWNDGLARVLGDRGQAMAAAAAFIVVLTALACWLPMRLGLRNLERVEF